jgi:hypothetical protein
MGTWRGGFTMRNLKLFITLGVGTLIGGAVGLAIKAIFDSFGWVTGVFSCLGLLILLLVLIPFIWVQNLKSGK